MEQSQAEQPTLEFATQALAEEQRTMQIGQRISHYQLLSLLGKGGMGEVYLAQDTNLKRQVALKLLPTQFTAAAERVQRFEQEARARPRSIIPISSPFTKSAKRTRRTLLSPNILTARCCASR